MIHIAVEFYILIVQMPTLSYIKRQIFCSVFRVVELRYSCSHCAVSHSVLKIKSWVHYYFQNKLSLIVQASWCCIAQVFWKVDGT